MLLYASKFYVFLYIITFLDSLWKGLQNCLHWKKLSLKIELKDIVNNHNQDHIIEELHTRATSPCDDFLDLRHEVSNGSKSNLSIQKKLLHLYNKFKI